MTLSKHALFRSIRCFIGGALLTHILLTHAQTTGEPDKACQTYFCMLDSNAAQQAICQPLVAAVFDTFAEGTHTVTCGSTEKNLPPMQVIHRKADENYCRPDLKTSDGKCSAEKVIDVSLEGALYTREWQIKSGAPSIEYYQGKSKPNYEPASAPMAPEAPPSGGRGVK